MINIDLILGILQTEMTELLTGSEDGKIDDLHDPLSMMLLKVLVISRIGWASSL